MFMVEIALLTCAILGGVLGSLAIYWARQEYCQKRVCVGQVLFIGILFCNGLGILVGVYCHAYFLAPLGLSSGLLLVGMLWEAPKYLPEQHQDLLSSN